MYVQYVYPGRFCALVSLFCCECVMRNVFVYTRVGVGPLGIGKAPCVCLGVCTVVCASASNCTNMQPCLCVCVCARAFVRACVRLCVRQACRCKSARVSLRPCASYLCACAGAYERVRRACHGLSPSTPAVGYACVRRGVLLGRLVRLLSHWVAADLAGCHLMARCDILMHAAV